MIVKSMNSKELINEIAKDLPMVTKKASYLTEGLRREAIKSKNKHICRIFNYKSKQLNDWFIVANHYIDKATFAVYVCYIDEYGFNGIAVSSDTQNLAHYTPHFIERYNQRFLKQDYMEKKELFKRFVLNNAIGTGIESFDNEENKYKHFVRFQEGIGLGFVEHFHNLPFSIIIHHKTYISNEMIHNGQRLHYEKSGERFKKIWQENHKRIRIEQYNLAS